MADVTLSDGVLVVTLREVPEGRGARAIGLEPLPTTTGEIVVYRQVAVLFEVPLAGRVESKAEVAHLESWQAAEAELTLTERDGTESAGLRIRPDQLSAKRKDGDSADWTVTMRLWRLP